MQGLLEAGTAICFLSCASAGRPPGYTQGIRVQGPSGRGHSKLLPFLCLSRAAAGAHIVFQRAGSFWRRAHQAASFPVPQPGGRGGTHCLLVCRVPLEAGQQAASFPVPQPGGRRGTHCLSVCRVLLEAGTASCFLSWRPPGYTLSFGVQGPPGGGTASCFLSCASARRPPGYTLSFGVQGPRGGGDSNLLPFLCLSRAAVRGAHCSCRVLLEAGTASCFHSCASAGRPPGVHTARGPWHHKTSATFPRTTFDVYSKMWSLSGYIGLAFVICM